MLEEDDDQAQGLPVASLPATTSTAEERGPREPDVTEPAVHAPHWQIEDEVEEADQPGPGQADANREVFQNLAEGDLVVNLPLEERSIGWESPPPPSPPEAPYQRPQRVVPPLPLPRDARTGIGRGSGVRPRDVERPRAPGGRRQWPGSDRCFLCGEVGHWSVDCQTPNAQGPVCFVCRQPGHQRGACPQLDVRRANYQRRDRERQSRNDQARSYVLEVARGRARLVRRSPPPSVRRVPPPPLTPRE